MLAGELLELELAAAHRHIDTCAACRELIADAVRAADTADAGPLARGASLGRYVVLDMIGAGAMGVVYAAWDPELQRKVALKVLRPDRGEDGSIGGERLLREAQAMAQLQHPNVIAVHDVGTVGDRVFVAMEIVEGETLDSWRRAGPHGWREVLRVLRQAGEGLLAAHAAGLVHRDFKPDNVLIGVDGRVRVTDFGLARPSDSAPVLAPADGPLLAATLERTGMLVGTPAYMAPEQIDRAGTDARSDIFSFCLTLYEALYDERPFAGDDLASLRDEIRAGAVRQPPSSSCVPARVRRLVVRGLAADPDARYPTMSALFHDLERASRRRGRLLALAAAVLAVVATTAIVLSRAAGERPCAGIDAAWGDAYGPRSRANIEQAFARSGRPWSRLALASVDDGLASYSRAWIGGRRRVCEAARVRHELSAPLFEARTQCLDDRRREVLALVRVLAAADGDVVDRATRSIDALGRIDSCLDLRDPALASAPRDPVAVVRRAAVREQLAEAKVLDDTGRLERGHAVTLAALAAAHDLGDRPLEAQLLYRRGHLEEELDLATAPATLHDAAMTAIEAGDLATAADAWTFLIYITGFDGTQRAEAERWAGYAAVALARLGGDDLREARRLAYLLFAIYDDPARAREALALVTRERELLIRAGAGVTQLLENEERRGGLAESTGRLDEALAAFHDAHETAARRLGADHQDTLEAETNEAETLSRLGRDAEAAELLRSVLAADLRGGRPAKEEAYVRFTLARALRGMHDYVGALDEDGRALAIYDRRSPPLSWITYPLTGRGEDLLAQDRARDAIAPLERALSLETSQGIQPADRAETELALARALWDGGSDRVRARRLAEAARADWADRAARFGSYYAAQQQLADEWLRLHPAFPATHGG
jgi:tRNA A-37 threonylcarbamoyl transferase component Bud32/tetratricopeptide (TPR) repeat protein